MNLDDFDTPMKNWRNQHPNDLENNFEKNGNNRLAAASNHDNSGDGESNGIPFAPQIDQKIETFSTSMYILVVLTLIVMLLFFNWYKKGRNNLRVRRKYFFLNRLGF